MGTGGALAARTPAHCVKAEQLDQCGLVDVEEVVGIVVVVVVVEVAG